MAIGVEVTSNSNVPVSQRHDNVFSRIQWWPSTLHTLYGTYAFSEQASNNRGTGGFNLPERGTGADRHSHKMTVIDDAPVRILFARRLVPEKGTRLISRVFEKLLKERANVQITIAGEGKDRELMAENFRGESRVSFCTYKTDESIATPCSVKT